jgi:hypothetical protein
MKNAEQRYHHVQLKQEVDVKIVEMHVLIKKVPSNAFGINLRLNHVSGMEQVVLIELVQMH